MAVNLSPVGGVAAQFFTNNGTPLTGGKLYTYSAGSTTPAATFTSSNGSTAWTNPIVLDAAGRVSGSGEIWLTDGVIYKFILKDSNDVLIATYDNITGINSNSVAFVNQQEIVTATAGQTVFNLGINYQPATNSLSVFVDGVNQYGPGALYAYVETDSNTVTFNSGLHVGAEVKFTTTQQQSAGSVDASQVTYEPPFTGFVATNVEAKLAQYVSVKDFGAVGDGVADDTAAIQAALDYVGNSGGGTVLLTKTNGKYRITQGLKIPSYVTFEGVAPDRYPFNGSTTSSCLLADFTNVNQWVIESASTLNGVAVPYNTIVSITDTFTYTYNCCVKNMRIEATNTIPFGAIRMVACPGSMVDNVSVVGTGAGLLVNQCYGGKYVMHCLTHYYGVIAWEDTNACNFDVYNACIEPPAGTVPPAYVMSFMDAIKTVLVSQYKLHTNAHYDRTWGMIIGGRPSVASNNRIKVVAERYSGGVFQLQAYGTEFDGLYTEGGPNVMDYACVASVSRFVVNSLHAFLSNTGKVLDLGDNVNARITAIGFIDYQDYGYGPYLDGSSLVVIDGRSPSDFGPAVPQFNMYYTAGELTGIVTAFQNSWVNDTGGGIYDVVRYVLKKQINEVGLTGRVTGGAPGTVIFTLPLGYRPLYRENNIVPGGEVMIDANGDVICVSGTTLYLDQVQFTVSP